MRITWVKPPQKGSTGRGIGFLNERLLRELKKIKSLEVLPVKFNFWARSYPHSDLIHFPYFDEFFFTLPPLVSNKFVVTVPDLTKLKFPQYFPLGKRAKIAWPVQKRLVGKAAAIITISQSAKTDIEHFLSYPSDKIFVTYLAADTAFRKLKDTKILSRVRSKYCLPEKFVLYVGGVNANKNLPTLIRACQQIKTDLVLVGKEFAYEQVDFSHPELRPFKEVRELVKDDPRMHRLGFVPTQDLVGIYNLAAVYVQPSIYEGFALPVLEAMSCATPVICGRNSSLPEIAGKAATYADVTAVIDLANKIKNFKKTGEETAQAAKFSWEKTARETYEVYKKILAD